MLSVDEIITVCDHILQQYSARIGLHQTRQDDIQLCSADVDRYDNNIPSMKNGLSISCRRGTIDRDVSCMFRLKLLWNLLAV